MTDGELFDELDYDGDGLLSREELRQVAVLFGWHWPQAQVYALLDYLTIRAPLDRDSFIACMARISADPDGVYGQALREGPLAAELSPSDGPRVLRPADNGAGKGARIRPGGESAQGTALGERTAGRLEDILEDHAAQRYAAAIGELGVPRLVVRTDEAALLIIDPQRSFTSGEWMRSLGPGGETEVSPIRRAFDNCARLLRDVYHRTEVMFTRCPFPPESYGWDERLEGIIDPWQLYFIKPGNNVLTPDANGCREWVEALIRSGTKVLVMGGCTLNSCIRVSARETRLRFRDDGLSVVADLSLCGARTSNYADSSLFEGISPVESAMREMSSAGIVIAERVAWL